MVTLRNGAAVNAQCVIRGDLHVVSERFTLSPAPDSVVLDLDGCFVFPGFINAHDHLHLNSLPPLTDLGPFPNAYRWIDAVQARRAQPDMVDAESTRLDLRLWHGALKNLLSGVTTVVHHDPWHALFDSPDFPVRVPAGYDWCHSLGLSGATPDATALRYGPCVEDAAEDARWYIHLAEGVDEIAASELGHLDRLGGLHAGTVLIHAAGLQPDDVQRVRDAGAWVVWCPASNQALLGSTLNPRPFAADGRLALGTDSRLSGSDDLLDELRAALRAGGTTLSPQALMALVTRDAARVIGRSDLGAILPPCRADFVVVESSLSDPYEVLLTSARRNLALVVRDGRPLLANARFAGWMRETAAAENDAIVELLVDGARKWCPRRVLGPAGAIELEPGVRVVPS